jgi:hypothetical protein
LRFAKNIKNKSAIECSKPQATNMVTANTFTIIFSILLEVLLFIITDKHTKALHSKPLKNNSTGLFENLAVPIASMTGILNFIMDITPATRAVPTIFKT